MSALPDIPQTSGVPQPIQATSAGSAPGGTHSTDVTQCWFGDRRVADALLAVHADLLDDYERIRVAHENRVRSLTSTWEIDGVTYGKGINPALPELQPFLAELEELRAREHGAALMLKRAMRRHYLGPWVHRTVGVGEKQAARLIAAIGDPATRERPSRLWAYCGLHVFHPGQSVSVSHRLVAGVEPSSAVGGSHPTDQRSNALHTCAVGGVAPKRQRGQKANWNTTAKMRVWLVAESCVKQRTSPYRGVYDRGREKYADATHNHPCPRCGPAGSPAPVGSPLNPGHQHARALRLVMKAVLLDLWREARA